MKVINEKKTNIFLFLMYFFFFLTILHLFIQINHILNIDYYPSLLFLKQKEIKLFKELESESSIGWFNLKEHGVYKKENDIMYLNFQYMLAPTILENHTFNKKIICYYTSPTQLAAFCKKNKKYKQIRNKIYYEFALLERNEK